MLADAVVTSALYKISLATGAATFVRNVASAQTAFDGLALVSRAVTLYGLTSPDHASAPGGAIITVLSAVRARCCRCRLAPPSAVSGPDDWRAGGGGVAFRHGRYVGITTTGRLLRINAVNGQSPCRSRRSAFRSRFNVRGLRLRSGRRSAASRPTRPELAASCRTPAWRTQGNGSAFTGAVALAYAPAAGALPASTHRPTAWFVRQRPPAAAAPVLALGTDVGPLTSFDISAADGTGFAAITAPRRRDDASFAISLLTAPRCRSPSSAAPPLFRGLASCPGRGGAGRGLQRLSAWKRADPRWCVRRARPDRSPCG